MDNRRQNVASNFIWRFAERCGAQGITFVVSIVLARVLEPRMYGTVALVTVFTNIINVFIDGGLGNALIQKKDADDDDFTSVFIFNLGMCIIVYGIMYTVAPHIAKFYDIPELTSIVRVMSVALVLSGVKNIQQSYVSKNLLFKRFFFSTLGGTIAAALTGIVMAYHGFGVWALVFQYVINNTIDTLILWITVRWRPRGRFSVIKLKRLITYGWKLLASHLLDTLYKNIRSLLIGKVYDETQLAYYNKGNQLPGLVISNTVSSLDSILFPVMSKGQDDREELRRVTRRINRVSNYMIWPLMIGLAACGEVLIEVLLTEKWLPCVPFMRLLCVGYAFRPIHATNLNIIKSCGRSDIYLKIEIIKKTIEIAVIIISLPHGVIAIALGEMLVDPITSLIDAYPSKSLIGYRIVDQIIDMSPAVILSLIMGIVVYMISFLSLSKIAILFIQIFVGVVVYIVLSVVSHNDSFLYLWAMIEEKKRKV